ncbi:Protein DJ-1-like protein B [Dichanthelium oligosanthes]|uniref:Protein DJ-1-like protein B n=1 Tax=Dichanthelium oligosanthes TaxID=888268 RepID=A0A1E5VII0_9POAL|nr:Protein DJ-1-like protein B [Dichanthelium oligosanthes]
MAAAASLLVRRAAAAASRRLLHARAFASGGGGGETAKRVLVPVAAGTEPIEAAATADVLNRAGARVTVATADPAGDDGLVVEAAYGVKLVADARVAELEGEAFDLIALPGGMPGSVNLRDCKALEKMVKNHAENGGLYGAICAAPAVTLAYWGMLKGLKATCYPSFIEKFTAEVIPVNSRVVVDRNAVTSQGPGTAIEFALALVERLYGKEKMEEVAGPLYVRPQHGVAYTIEELNSVEWKCTGTPQVLVPVANGSEEMEAINLIDVLRRAGVNVTVASVEEKLQIVTRRHKFNLIADIMLDEATDMQFDLIVMPGGLQGAQKFASTKKLVDLLKKQAESNKPYGAICASPAYVLEPHGLLKGKKATAFPPMSHVLTDKSACKDMVVVDGNLITSQAPGTATEFALAIVEKLLGRDKAISIAKELIFM